MRDFSGCQKWVSMFARACCVLGFRLLALRFNSWFLWVLKAGGLLFVGVLGVGYLVFWLRFGFIVMR
jgi:hypothetical protein